MAQLARRCAVGVAVAATLTACGTGVPKRTADVTPPPAYAAAAARSDWAHYFAQPGTTCTRRLVPKAPRHRAASAHRTSSARTRALPAISDPKVTGEQPAGIALTDEWSTGAAWNTFEGMSFVVSDHETLTLAKSRTQATSKTVRTLYSITKAGELQVPPQSQLKGKDTVANENALVYPSIAELRSGASDPLEVRFAVTPSDDPDVGSFAGLTTDGSSAIRMAVTYQFTLVASPASIVTPSGTYTDVLGLQTRVSGLHPLNLPGRYASVALSVFGSGEDVTTDWFARGVGLVREVDSRGTTDLVGCSPYVESSS